MRLGELEVEAIHDGTFALDGGAMFGLVPRPLWEKELAPDALNRVLLALRCLLVRAPGRVALVGTGIGERWPDKLRDQFAIDRSTTVLGELAARGIAPEDITDVILTHLHFDHAGGVLRPDGSLTFPRAQHHLQRRQWRWAQAPTERDRGSFRAEDFAPLLATGKLVLRDGPAEIFRGLEVVPTEGHTPALQVVVLSSGKLVYPADLVPTAAHLKLAWGMSYDLKPLQVLDEKKALLARAARDGAVIVFEHDPRLAACTVRGDGRGFSVERQVAL